MSGSWSRVGEGARLVAIAAARRAASDANSAADAAVRHGPEVAMSLRAAAVEAAAAAPGLFPNATEMMTRTAATRSSSEGSYSSSSMMDRINGSMNGDTSNVMNGHNPNGEISFENVEAMQKSELKNGIQSTQEVTFNKDNNRIETVFNQVSRETEMKSGETEMANETEPPHPPPPSEELSKGMNERAVPSTRVGRAFGFASLGVGLAAGTVMEATSRLMGSPSSSSSSSTLLGNDANADRLASTLCRMRGAALKLGQMLSMQDATIMPPALDRALQRVRDGTADAMPQWQLRRVLEAQFGDADHWQNISKGDLIRVEHFDAMPFAAASIGQVHRASILSLLPTNDDKGSLVQRDVVMKIQYPGVAESIDSDLDNLRMIVSWTGFAPKGLFINQVIRVARNELRLECDYERELSNHLRLRSLVHADAQLANERIVVPDVIPELSTSRILTTEYANGTTIDAVAHLHQSERNRIGRAILMLTMKELFDWRFMQTDPNWGNFLYDVGTGTTSLIDFGGAREYDKTFVDGYLRIVWAAANMDQKTLMEQSDRMGFFTGDENDTMLEAHKLSGFTLGEPFATEAPYDFKSSEINLRLSRHASVFLQHRLTPPPSEVYSLHRKLAGAYMLCIKLGANVSCRQFLVDLMERYEFDDGLPHPLATTTTTEQIVNMPSDTHK